MPWTEKFISSFVTVIPRMISGIEVDSELGYEVCSELIALLSAHLVCFVTELMSTVVTLVTQDKVRKVETKVFKSTRENVTSLLVAGFEFH